MNLDRWVSARQFETIMLKIAEDIRAELDKGLKETEALRAEVINLRRDLETERRTRLGGRISRLK
jgi:hypothetical protein